MANQLANILGCSAFTIKCHKSNVMRKLNVNSAQQIVNWLEESSYPHKNS
jgi:DNA-binding CsgD family transcriptional regulator